MPYDTVDTEKDIGEGNGSRTSLSDLEDCPLNGNEERFHLKQPRKWRPKWPGNGSPFWKVWSIAMTASSIILLIFNLNAKITVHKMSTCSSSTTSSVALEEYPDPIESWKKENLIETKYYRDLRYMTLSHDMDWLWKEHTDMATGNVILPAENGHNASLKGISMFHQMHCLAKMRMALQQSREGIDIGEDWMADAHWPHCFDYLRSSILCSADPTLESVSRQPGPKDDGSFVRVIDGGDETRYCRDTKPLYELVRHYGPNSQYGFKAKSSDFEVAPGK